MREPLNSAGASCDTRRIRGRLARGSGAYAVTNFGLRGLGFALLVFYSRFLSPHDFGIVSIAESIGAGIGIVAGLALEAGCRSLYFHFVEDADQLRSYLSTVLRLAAAAGATTLAAAYLFGPWIVLQAFPGWQASFFPYLALPILTAIVSQLLACRLVIFQCQERFFTFNAFVVLQSITTALLTLGLVVWKHHGAAGLLSARAIGACLTLAVAVCGSGPLLRARYRWAYARETLQVSLPLVIHGLMALGLIAIDRFILQHYRSLSDVGLYSVAYSVGLIMTIVTASLNRAWAPLFYSLLRDGGEGRQIVGEIGADLFLLLALIASAGALLAPVCIHRFFDIRYWPAATIAPILLGAYLCHSLFSILQLSLIQARRTGLVTLVSGTALLTNIALNFTWIPQYGMTGAAYATLGGYAVELGLIAIFAQQVLRLPYGWLRPSLALFAGVSALLWTRFAPADGATLVFATLLIATCTALVTSHFLVKTSTLR